MISDLDAADRRSFYTGEMTTISLDDGANTLYLHRDLYLISQLESSIDNIGGSDETGRKINIYGQDKDAVAGYIDCLYRGKIEGYEYRDGDTMYLELAQLYIFGQRIEDHDFCDEVLEVILKGMDKPPSDDDCWLPCPRAITLVYENTVEDDPLRRLFVDCTVHLATEKLVTG